MYALVLYVVYFSVILWIFPSHNLGPNDILSRNLDYKFCFGILKPLAPFFLWEIGKN